MALENLVIRSQLIPPRSRKGVLQRTRLDACLQAVLDVPLTIVQAGTGYGKSTALASFSERLPHLFWYTITETERDPLLFLVHLLSAFNQSGQAWGDAALAALEEGGSRVAPAALTPLLNNLTRGLTADAVLVLDDYHLVHQVPEIAALVRQMVNHCPPYLHLVLATRHPPRLDDLPRWRAKGQVLSIGRAELAFTAEEIEHLFQQQYGRALSPEQARSLAAETEGWIIALQMVWQSLQSGAAPNLEAVLAHLPGTLEALFDYLAPEVLARQPADVQCFLLTTSVLRSMDGPACDALFAQCSPALVNSAEMLRRLHENGLFLDAVGEGAYRYQKLFQDFLQAQLTQEADKKHTLHRQAAAHFQRTGQLEETIYHLLQAEDYEPAARLIVQIGPGLVEIGRLGSLVGWIERLPQNVYAALPELNLLLGDVLRLRADFDAALQHYTAAEEQYSTLADQLGRSRSLRGQAQVYLDTVRPLKADALLGEALRLLEPQEHREEAAALYDQMAENKLNLGYPEQAQMLHAEAQMLRAEVDPGDVYLEARAMLRTGRLVEARRLLAPREHEESQLEPSRPQRFHRETALLLSLICAMQGDQPATERYARAGIAIGQALNADFVEAVGIMRLGHALQLSPAQPWGENVHSQAAECYLQTIEKVRPFKVMRVWVEPLWGLVRVYGYAGDLAQAEHSAERALQIADQSGDEWIGDLVRVSMGASYVLAGQNEAADAWLSRAFSGFERVGDPFGQAAALLWQALGAWWQGDTHGAARWLKVLLPLAHTHRLDALLTRRTLLGLKDDQSFLPLLLEARRQGIEAEYAGQLLHELGLDELDDHPGYTLWVRVLGSFSVWRGDTPVAAPEWQRDKARQLFQLLVTSSLSNSRRGAGGEATYRPQFLQREQIVDLLWPNLPADAAIRDFKVALNALNRALEPARRRDEQPFFVIRRGNAYGLNPAARLEVDAALFAHLVDSAQAEELQQALALYEGEYLPDCRYEDWAAAQREHLRQAYLTAAERLAESLSQAANWDEVIRLSEMILAQDACWEAAYRLLLRAYAARGNRSQLHHVYQRCAKALDENLGLPPSPQTRTLFEQLSG